MKRFSGLRFLPESVHSLKSSLDLPPEIRTVIYEYHFIQSSYEFLGSHQRLGKDV